MATSFDSSPRQQSTLADRVSVAGYGFWSGQDIRLEFRPAAADTGIVFVREDLPGNPRIPARVDLRVDRPRRTNLVQDDTSVEMVEHVMAALAGLQVDNCEIWATGAEMPGCDGSSLPFAEAIQSVGIRWLAATRRRYKVTSVVRVGDDDAWLEARPAAQGMTVEYHLDYGPGSAITSQSVCQLVTSESFLEALAPARTFVLEDEADHLRSLGLGLRVTSQELLVFGPQGPLENRLRFSNECARHKALDMVGDFALCGIELVGHFIAHRSGHQLNATLTRQLRELYDMETLSRKAAS